MRNCCHYLLQHPNVHKEFQAGVEILVILLTGVPFGHLKMHSSSIRGMSKLGTLTPGGGLGTLGPIEATDKISANKNIEVIILVPRCFRNFAIHILLYIALYLVRGHGSVCD